MFELNLLNYEYNALEPFVDARTVEIHYTMHHQNYYNNLNKVVENYPQYNEVALKDILKDVESIPAEIRQAVINNGGGLYNHNLYWENMAPQSENNLQKDLLEQINNAFSSLADFQRLFTDSALKLFGSGWTWLVKDKNSVLKIVNTANQDCPVSDNLQPLLALDVWEHAYYLKYQNRRAEYVQNWWNVINWKVVAERLISLPV